VLEVEYIVVSKVKLCGNWLSNLVGVKYIPDPAMEEEKGITMDSRAMVQIAIFEVELRTSGKTRWLHID
jgi:hypothetical protein